MKKNKARLKENIYFFDISPQQPNRTKVTINLYSKRLPKDVLTTDVIDYDFLEVKLNPPKKQKRQYYFQWQSSYFYGAAMNKKKDKKNSSTSSSGTGGGNTRGDRVKKQQKQLCMFKCFYSNDKKQHTNFLKNYMPQKNINGVIDKPKLFNDDFDVLPDDKILEYENNMTDMHYKFILSPESQKVPIKDFVRSYMKQLEAITGYSLNYIAVEHTNTGHNHCHILINGKDKNGKEIHFDRQFFKETGREIASTLCTNYVGYRTQKQIQDSKEKALNAFHLTSLDQTIIQNEKKFSSMQVINGIEYEGEYTCSNDKMKRRLEILSKIGFAKYKKDSKRPPVFYLVKNWAASLKSAKNFNSFLKARTNLVYTSANNLEQYRRDTGEITGVITQRFIMNNEDNWNNAIVIENKQTGQAYYVPIGFEPEQKLIGCNVRCFIPTGLMHPKILVQNKERTIEKENK